MAGPNFDVRANVTQATQAVNQVNRAIDDAAKTAERGNKRQYRPLASGALDELREAVKLMRELSTLSARTPNVTQGIGAGGTGPLAPITPPRNGPSEGGSGGGSRHRRGGRWSNYGQDQGIGRYANAFTSGVGGPTSTIASEAMRGSQSGGGGFSALGLLRGALGGLGLFAAYKAGSAITEGYESAKSKAIDIDSLKRAMGDLGKSFSVLQAAADESARGLGINSNEAAKLALEYNRLSGGLEGPADMVRELRNSVGFGRSYGMDPSQSGQFFAGMRMMGGRGDEQSSRRLALLIGETISRTGMNARAAELISAIQSFASATNRQSLAAPNVEGYTGAFSGLIGLGIKGMTSDTAMSIIGAANQAVMGMGAAGEAGQNFTMAALSKGGGLNPIQAAILAEGGLFGTRRGAFGSGSAYYKYMQSQGADISGLGTGGGTNFDAIRSHLDTLGGGADLKLDAAKRYFGLSSYNQAAALLAMNPQRMGALGSLLGRNGINVGDVNETGISTLGDIATAGSKDDLMRVFSSMKGRRGKGALTPNELSTLDAASGQDVEKFRDALVKIAASKDQEETEGNKTRQTLKDIETATTGIGEKLLGPMNTMRDALLVMAGKGGAESIRKLAMEMDKADVHNELSARAAGIQADFMQKSSAPGLTIDDRKKLIAERDAKMKVLDEEKAKRFKDIEQRAAAEVAAEKQVNNIQSGQSTDRQAIIDEVAKSKGIDPKLLSAIPRLERSGANATSPKGAKGEFQIMPGNVPAGMDPTNFRDGAMMAAQVLKDAQRLYPGNTAAQIAYYNGGKKAGDAVAAGNAAPSKETRDYLARANGMGLIDDAPLPKGATAAAGDKPITIRLDGEFRNVDASGRQVSAPVPVSTTASVPRSAGVR